MRVTSIISVELKTMTIRKEEQAEIQRILSGGDYDESFWHKRWSAARTPSEEELLREELRNQAKETVADRRAARKLARKLQKLAGKRRAFSRAGYAWGWGEEQKRLDNLQHAAIYLSRANTGFHFYA